MKDVKQEDRPTFGMKLALRDANDGGTFNTVVVEARRPHQSLEDAVAEARANLDAKREAWRKIYPDIKFEIVQIRGIG